MGTIRKAMVLAGGNDQIELIKGIRNRFPDVEIILIDMNPNVRAREYADRMLVISTMDFEAVLTAAKNENIDLILSACGDQPMRTMAYVSEKLGLPCYLTYEQSENLTNKVLMKRKMIDGGIPTSKYNRFDINSDIITDGLSFPLVIKPADNNGSKGIIKVYSQTEFDAAIAEARKYTLGGDLLVEEFKEGEEYSIEAFLKDGEPHIIFASKNEKIKHRNTFTICRNVYVNKLSDKFKANLEDIIVKIGQEFGINNVPLLIQLIANGDDLSVIEFSARTGGGSKLFFIREMVGVDVIDNLLDITFGLTPNISVDISALNAVINYVYTKPGKFTAIEGLEGLVADGYISASYQYKPFGSEIKSANYSSDRPIGFLIKAESDKQLEEKIAVVNNRIRILNEDGNDIMCHDIFLRK